MALSAIPAAIEAVLVRVRGLDGYAAPGELLEKGWWPVFDGADLRDTDSQRAVVIGSTATFDDVRITDASLSYGLDSREEPFDLACSALRWSGDSDIPGMRADVFAVVDDVDELLRADPQLGGAVIDARLGRVGYRVAQQRGELVVASDFRIRLLAG